MQTMATTCREANTKGFYALSLVSPLESRLLFKMKTLVPLAHVATGIALGAGIGHIEIPEDSSLFGDDGPIVTVRRALQLPYAIEATGCPADREVLSALACMLMPRTLGPAPLEFKEVKPDVWAPTACLPRMQSPKISKTGDGDWLAGYYDVNDRELNLLPSLDQAKDYIQRAHNKMWEAHAEHLQKFSVPVA